LNIAEDFFAKKGTNLDAMDGGDMCRVPYVQDEMPAEAVYQKLVWAKERYSFLGSHVLIPTRIRT
jgi:hypothetical protein